MDQPAQDVIHEAKLKLQALQPHPDDAKTTDNTSVVDGSVVTRVSRAIDQIRGAFTGSLSEVQDAAIAKVKERTAAVDACERAERVAVLQHQLAGLLLEEVMMEEERVKKAFWSTHANTDVAATLAFATERAAAYDKRRQDCADANLARNKAEAETKYHRLRLEIAELELALCI